MGFTHDFHETVQDRLRRDPEFRECVLAGGVESLLTGEIEVARITLRDYVLATVGFEKLGIMTGRSAESVYRMFDPEGDPRAGDLFEVIPSLLRHEGLVLQVNAVRGEPEADDRAAAEPVAAR
jgi:DNA-binding phage protein